MHVSRLYIKNYRSIREIDINFKSGKNIIVGRNNSGKSNIIDALDLVLGEASPTWNRSDKIDIDDFHSYKIDSENGAFQFLNQDEIIIWVELERSKDESIDYEELYKCPGFYVHAYEETARIYVNERHIISNISEISQLFNEYSDEISSKKYINTKNKQHQTLERELGEMYRFAFCFRANLDENDIIQKDLRFFYREDEHHGWSMAFRANIRNEIILTAIIPAFRSPDAQLRISSWTWYGKLLKHLTKQSERLDEINLAFKKVEDHSNELFADIRRSLIESGLNVAFPGTDIIFTFNAKNRIDIYKTAMIYVDDGFVSKLSDKGSGIQSFTIIGLFNYYVNFINKIGAALLCLEEPELFLHPHARRVLSDRLDNFASHNNQVIITTHSVDFIRSIDPSVNIIHLQKSNGATIGQNIMIRDLRNLLFDPSVSEMFFADKVVLCEGLDAFILREIVDNLHPGAIDSQNISIINCGGKDNISRFAKLANMMNLKCYIFCDFDYILRDKDEEKSRKYQTPIHESLSSLKHDFWRQTDVFTDGMRLIKHIDRLRPKIKSEQENLFYTAKKVDDFQGEYGLLELIIELRSQGVCILNGEIEDFCIEKSLMSGNKKLSFSTIYDLRNRIISGTQVGDLFDIPQIEQFVEHLLRIQQNHQAV